MMKNKINWLACLSGVIVFGSLPAYAGIRMTPSNGTVFAIDEQITLDGQQDGDPQPPNDECKECDQTGTWNQDGDADYTYSGDVNGTDTLDASSSGEKSGTVTAKFYWNCSETGDSSETTETDTFTYTVVKVEFDSVDGADEIGSQDGKKIYATAQSGGDITISLKATPDDAQLPADFVSWSGGNSGSDQLKRTLSKAELKVSGESVGANVKGNEIVKTKLYVFEGKPNDWDVKKVIADIKISNANGDATIWDRNEFGAMVHGDTQDAQNIFNVYYEDKKWHFYLDKCSKNIRWGYRSLGRTNILEGKKYSDKAPPLPGLTMSNSSSYIERKNQVISDFTRMPGSNTCAPPCTNYISLELVIKHEVYHFNDWKDHWLPDAIKKDLSKEIAMYGDIDVTTSKISPDEVLKQNTNFLNGLFKARIKTKAKDFTEDAPSEVDAHTYTDALFLQIINNFK